LNTGFLKPALRTSFESGLNKTIYACIAVEGGIGKAFEKEAYRAY